MRQIHWPHSFIAIALFLGAMQALAVWVIPHGAIHGWYDKIQHFLGGAMCAHGGIALYHLSIASGTHDHATFDRTTIRLALLFGMTGGIGWEILEHEFPELGGGPHSYASPDTILDLIFDYLGALVTGLVFSWDASLYDSRRTKRRE